MLENKDNLIFSTLPELRNSINEKNNISVFGLSFGEKAIFLSTLKNQIVYITKNMLSASNLAKQLKCFGKTVKTIFFKQTDLLMGMSTAGQNIVDTIDTLISLSTSKVDCLIITPDVLMQKFPNKNEYKNNIIKLSVNKNFDQKLLIQNLNNLGYKRVESVQNAGDFAVRGDIVDVFNILDQVPTRIEFFDDEIEKIYTFGVLDYKKIKEIKLVTIAPINLFNLNTETKYQIFKNIQLNYEKTIKTLDVNKDIILKSNFEEFKLHFDSNNTTYIQNWVTPFMPSNSILSYLNNDCLVVYDDVKQIVDAINTEYQIFEDNFNSLKSSGDILLEHKNFYNNKTDVYNTSLQQISFQNINTSNRIFNPDVVYSYKSSAETKYLGNYNLLLEDLNYYLEYKNTVVIFCSNKSTAEYLKKFLNSNNIISEVVELEQTEKNRVNIVVKDVAYGAIFVEDNLVVIGTEELQKKSATKKVKSEEKKDEFVLPKVGDYVVHETFGVGICEGIQKLKFSNYEKDYIILKYEHGDKLYLPTEQIGLISAYVANGKTPKLNKLGSKEFENTKTKVKNSLKELAFDLIKLYSERENAKGYKFEVDEQMFAEFEDRFMYDETDDQLEAIKEIKQDMTSNKIMDRLVCGDVGYGKTEVSLRAAFICAMNNKQVAFLAPTTVLSQQHFNTAKQRFADFGIKVECLNRFKTKKEQTEIIKKLKEGEIDIICGTHRLLSKDVHFKNLGLLILDEEQRFGVGDKEKIKRLKSSIDVLTLSATPIPRTLHMGLVGIRDISIIATAPAGRLPVQTSITEYSDSLMLQAINRELSRNGQVLIIYNRVESIYQFAGRIRNLLPQDVSIGVAHGQMEERELETQILNLYEGKTKILISTTLIENGVDLPNANTLIIINADKLGLSQLYQLKGRVGRSKNLGYAYFTYDRQKALTEDAYKRLNAIMEFTELGSGFKIAMRDLEIRGCGNILGPEQSGHMAKVGYDMYCKILSQAVQEIKGQKQKEYKEIKLDVAINCFIPEDFIKNSDERFRIYNNLKQINSLEKRDKVVKSVSDLYGDIPDELNNLSYVALLRNLAREFDVKRISIDRERCMAEFYLKEDMLLKEIATALKEKGVKVYFAQTGAIMNFMLSEYSVKKKLQIVCEIFENAIKLKTDKNNLKK